MVKLFNRAVNGIYILIIILLIVYIWFRYTDKIEIYNVTTGSMEEDIHRGDYILIYKKDRNYKVGDVVTFRIDDYFVTHRIVKIEDEYITTKGDANNAEDAKINKSAIVGKVIIAGGILNIIINYKFSIVAVLLAIYLLSCYIGKGNKEEKIEKDNEEKMEELEELGELIDDTKNEENNEEKSKVEEKTIKDEKETNKKTEKNNNSTNEEIKKKKKTTKK